MPPVLPVPQGTVFSRVLPGEYIQAGGQGAYRLGFVEAAKAGLQVGLSTQAFD